MYSGALAVFNITHNGLRVWEVKNIPVKIEKNIFYLLYPLLCAGRIFSTKFNLKTK